MKTIYIAGPMRGVPHLNFPAFDAAAERLKSLGWDVISPAQMDRDNGFDAMEMPEDSNWDDTPPNFSLEECVDRDTDAVKNSDALYMLTGWEESVGAKAEHALAVWLGKEILYEREDHAVHLEVYRQAARVLEELQGPMDTWPVYDEINAVQPFLPEDAAERKTYPMYSGCLAYFPDALAAVSHVSYEGNEQHHPGTPLHWDRSKSSDEPDALMRHLVEGEWGQVAWRALALLQRKIDDGWRPEK